MAHPPPDSTNDLAAVVAMDPHGRRGLPLGPVALLVWVALTSPGIVTAFVFATLAGAQATLWR